MLEQSGKDFLGELDVSIDLDGGGEPRTRSG